MSYRSINSGATGKGIRSNHRTQLNWFRCTGITEALEHLDQEESSGRHADSFKTFEPTVRRRPQPQRLGDETEESEDRVR